MGKMTKLETDIWEDTRGPTPSGALDEWDDQTAVQAMLIATNSHDELICSNSL